MKYEIKNDDVVIKDIKETINELMSVHPKISDYFIANGKEQFAETMVELFTNNHKLFLDTLNDVYDDIVGKKILEDESYTSFLTSEIRYDLEKGFEDVLSDAIWKWALEWDSMDFQSTRVTKEDIAAYGPSNNYLDVWFNKFIYDSENEYRDTKKELGSQYQFQFDLTLLAYMMANFIRTISKCILEKKFRNEIVKETMMHVMFGSMHELVKNTFKYVYLV